MAWTVELLDESMKAAREALPDDIQASFLRISRLIGTAGLANVHEPYVKHLEGKLWEMRMKGKDGIARTAYVTARATALLSCTCSPRRRVRLPAAESKRPYAEPKRSNDP